MIMSNKTTPPSKLHFFLIYLMEPSHDGLYQPWANDPGVYKEEKKSQEASL